MKPLLIVNLVLALGLFLALVLQVLIAREILRFFRQQAAINREQLIINSELRRLVEQLGAGSE